jgi:hypothetical protein
MAQAAGLAAGTVRHAYDALVRSGAVEMAQGGAPSCARPRQGQPPEAGARGHRGLLTDGRIGLFTPRGVDELSLGPSVSAAP